MPHSGNGSFAAFLSTRLRVGTVLHTFHVSTPATLHPPIFAELPGTCPEPTTCESHFLGVTQNSDHGSGISGNRSEVLVLGIEVLIFATPSLTTIFVSKADSTGFLVRRSSVANHGLTTNDPHLSTSKSGATNTLDSSSNSAVHTPNAAFRNPNSTAQVVITAFLEYLTRASLVQRTSSRLVLSLFARSQSQYLFPGSVENSSKHVLDDRQLIKWWCKVLSPLLEPNPSHPIPDSSHSKDERQKNLANDRSQISDTENWHLSKSTSADLNGATAYILVPGCDKFEISRSYLPASSTRSASVKSTDLGLRSRWCVKFPVEDLRPSSTLTASANEGAVSADSGGVHAESEPERENLAADQPSPTPLPVQCVIPRLPDDPKARFCDDLDLSVDEKGRWRSVKSLSEFWELMEYRQECSAGRLVGFIWVVFDMHSAGDSMKDAKKSTLDQEDPNTKDRIVQHSVLPTVQDESKESNSQKTQTEATSLGTGSTTYSSAADFTAHAKETNPEDPNDLSTRNVPNLTPLSVTRTGSVLLTKEQYETLSALLIDDLDFGGIEKAIESTETWGKKLQELSGRHDIRKEVRGLASMPDLPSTSDSSGAQLSNSAPSAGDTPAVNVITAIRKKKRKAEDAGLEGESRH